MNILKKLPLPIVGLMLGLAALGNLLMPISPLLRYILGSTSGLIAVLVILKIILMPKCLKEAFNNPVVGSVMAAFPMGLMLLSVYIKPLSNALAFGTWIIALIIHFVFIAVFTKKYIFNFNIKKVFPSYFVMYVGIVVGSVTSPAYQMQNLGQIIFWIGLVSYLVLLPVVIYRVAAIKEMPTPSLPTKVIFSAPASLCIAGYMKAFSDKSPVLVYGLGILAFIMVIYALVQLPKLLRLPFMPSYSAFTFPLVISAIASSAITKFTGSSVIGLFSTFLMIVATVMVLYVLFTFIRFLFSKDDKTKGKEKTA